MQKKKNNHRGMGKGFFGLVGAAAAAYAIISFCPKFLERGKIEKQAGLERKLETKVVQPVEVNEVRVNEPNEVRVSESNNVRVNESNSLNYVVKEKGGFDYKTKDFLKDTDEVLLARMLFGEARNCSKEEKIAIAYTVINRVNGGKKWNGENIKEVILKPWQYSCFNKNDINYEKLKNPDKKIFEDCLKVADEVLQGKYKEFNRGQTHYFNPKVVKPKWAEKMEKIGKINNTEHEFYIEN